MLIFQLKSSTSRVFATWKGPTTVVDQCSRYSYVVERDGVRYRLHANQLRIFFVRVDEVNIDGYGNEYDEHNEYYTIVIIFNALPLCFQF